MGVVARCRCRISGSKFQALRKLLSHIYIFIYLFIRIYVYIYAIGMYVCISLFLNQLLPRTLH